MSSEKNPCSQGFPLFSHGLLNTASPYEISTSYSHFFSQVHNKVRPFPCRHCDKAFATKSDLNQHMNVHGEGKVFKCDQCDRV